jgi:hypothetical protein
MVTLPCGVPKTRRTSEKSAICRQDANFGTPQGSSTPESRTTSARQPSVEFLRPRWRRLWTVPYDARSGFGAGFSLGVGGLAGWAGAAKRSTGANKSLPNGGGVVLKLICDQVNSGTRLVLLSLGIAVEKPQPPDPGETLYEPAQRMHRATLRPFLRYLFGLLAFSRLLRKSRRLGVGTSLPSAVRSCPGSAGDSCCFSICSLSSLGVLGVMC